MKILLISQNDVNIKKIIDIFPSDNILNKHQLIIYREYIKERNIASDVEFLIIDLFTNQNSKEQFFTFLKSLPATGLPKLLLLSENQAEILREIYKYPIRLDDFIFIENLACELGIRIENILFQNFLIKPENSISIDGMILDLDKYELLINGKKIELTFKEYELLKILLENKNKVFTRTQLLLAVWDYEYYGGSRTVDVHMRRLRSKLDLPYSDMLKTVRNVGYMFSPSE